MITALIFLVMLTIIGVTAARMSSLEERMAGNMRDRDVALRAAEMCLREAERAIMNSTTIAACNGVALNVVVNCTSPAPPVVSAVPSYRIVNCSSPSITYYTIRVDAQGAKPGTTVTLEETLVSLD